MDCHSLPQLTLCHPWWHTANVLKEWLGSLCLQSACPSSPITAGLSGLSTVAQGPSHTFLPGLFFLVSPTLKTLVQVPQEPVSKPCPLSLPQAFLSLPYTFSSFFFFFYFSFLLPYSAGYFSFQSALFLLHTCY